MILEIGSRVGRYRILELIERSGTVIAYVGFDSEEQRRVALRELPGPMARDEPTIERLSIDARRLAALGHEGIVPLASIEHLGDRVFAASRWVEGETLEQLLAHERLDETELQALALGVTDALAAAHRAGVLHGALGPSRVVVEERRGPRLIGFGLTTTDEDHDRIYLSPEHAGGHPIDRRSDLFSLGSLLYHAATGRRPFSGETQMERAIAVQRDTPPPVDTVRPGLSAELSRVIERCMEKEPTRRFTSASEVQQTLAGIARGDAPVAAAPVFTAADHRPQGRLLWLAAGGAGLLALIAAALLVVDPLGWRAAETTAPPAAPEPVKVEPDSGPAALVVRPFAGDDGVLAFAVRDRLATLEQLAVLPAERVASENDAASWFAGPSLCVEGELVDGPPRVATLRLIQLADETTLWAESFEAPTAPAIATALVDALGFELGGLARVAMKRPDTLDPSVRLALVQGRQAAAERSEEGARRALEHFDRARQLDARSAGAHAGAALAMLELGDAGADDAARRAYSIDPGEVAANVALGAMLFDREPATARQRFERAVAIEPSHAAAHQWLARTLARDGALGRAAAHYRFAARLDPTRLDAMGERAYLYVLRGRFQQALDEGQRLVDSGAHAAAGHRARGAALAASGRPKRAEQELRASVELAPWNESAVLELFEVMVELDSETRLEQAARWYARRFPELRLGEVIERYIDARVALRRGESRRTLDLLEGLDGSVLGDPLVDWRFGDLAARAESTLGRHDAAVKRLRATLTTFPAWQAGRLRLADTLAAAGKHDNALSEYRAFLERWSDADDSEVVQAARRGIARIEG